MIKKILLLSLLCITQIHAKEYLLKGPSCSWLYQQIDHITSWSKKESTDLNCQCDSKKCHINVYSLLPSTVQKVIKGHNAYGPNCWNAALVGASILPNFIYTTPEEIEFWLSSPLCRMREAGEALQPGDVIEVRRMKTDVMEGFGPPGGWEEYEENKFYYRQEVHGMIYLSDQLVFTKNGASAGHDLYKLMPLQNAYSSYSVSMKCHNLDFIPETTDEVPCGSLHWSNIYQCQNAMEYFKDYRLPSKQKLIYQQVVALEEKVVAMLFTSKELKATPIQIQMWKEEANKIKNTIKQIDQNSGTEKLFWEILAVHTQSILRQIHNL